MDDNTALWIILIVGAMCFLVARYLDVAYRVKLLRRLTKRDWHMIKLVGLDMKSIQTFALDINQGIFNVDNGLWYALNGHIYREETKPDGSKGVKSEDGFIIKPKNVITDEGVPTLFIYKDSMKPANFDRADKSTIKPEEAGANINGYIATEIEKDQVKQAKILLYVTLALLGLALVLGGVYFVWQQASAANANSAACTGNTQLIMNHFGIVPPTNSSNETNTSGMLPTNKPGVQ